MPVRTVELDPQGLSKLHYNQFGATFEYAPLSTAVAGTKTTTIDLLAVAELIGAPVTIATLTVIGGASAPSTAVTTLRVSQDGSNFLPTATAITGVSAAAPVLRYVAGNRYIDAAITTAEASDDVVVFITMSGVLA